jgi:signal transduction histidine kinase
LTVRDGGLCLRVDDDGRGLPAVGSSGSAPHYGLRAMRERAAAMGADLEVGQGPGRRGTSVILRVPLAGHAAASSEPAATGA